MLRLNIGNAVYENCAAQIMDSNSFSRPTQPRCAGLPAGFRKSADGDLGGGSLRELSCLFAILGNKIP